MEVYQKGTQSHGMVWVRKDIKGHLVPAPITLWWLGHFPLEVTGVIPEDDEFEAR